MLYLFIFFLLFTALLSPALFVIMLMGFFFLLPFVLLAHSLQFLIAAPISLWQTFTNRQVRRNHALEHATANVLEEKYGMKMVAGMAFADGFKLFGQLPPPAYLVDAAREGLARLQRGETHLALHPRCGTSLIVGQFLFALAFVAIFVFMHHFSFIEVLAVFLLSSVLSRPLGLLAQKYLTTGTDVKDLEFVDLSMDRYGQFYFRTGYRGAFHRVRPAWPLRSPIQMGLFHS